MFIIFIQLIIIIFIQLIIIQLILQLISIKYLRDIFQVYTNNPTLFLLIFLISFEFFRECIHTQTTL